MNKARRKAGCTVHRFFDLSVRTLHRILISVAFFTCAPVFGATGGSVGGSITDPSGAVLPSAQVVLTSREQHNVLSALSNGH